MSFSKKTSKRITKLNQVLNHKKDRYKINDVPSQGHNGHMNLELKYDF